MWRETNLLGVYISPLVTYLLAALLVFVLLRPILVRLGLVRWTWNTPLAETAIYLCILGALIAFI